MAKSTLDARLDNLGLPEALANKLIALQQSEMFPYFDEAGINAIILLIKHMLETGYSTQKIEKILFNPTKPNLEEIGTFRARHQEIYKEMSVGLAREIDSSVEQFFAITSSMYAGKSTLAAEVCSQLRIQGYRVITMVPHFMSDDGNATFVTLRGREVQDDDVIGNDGFARIDAIAYDHSVYEEIIRSMNISLSEKVIIHFDEFSFLPADCLLEFIQYITVNHPNVKVLFVGLDKNALGQELDGYTAVKSSVTSEFACRSFVPNTLESVDTNTEPTGTFTSRYVVLPDGTMVLDCGFLPVVVPKEFSRLVYYTPANQSEHMYTILTIMEELEILSAIVAPNDAQREQRERLFSELQLATAVES